MKSLRRTIHPERIRVLDATKGQVQYIASNQTPDSYAEIIMASGWRFTQFKKNAPFVDSHDYGTIDKVLGRVIDYRVDGDQLVETVQWAIDVAGNTLAQRGFQMTAAGYLKAVSVGFMPTRMVTKFDSNLEGWSAACKELDVDPDSPLRCIYLEQEQLELSACVLGANPDAVALARKSGILSDREVETFWPQVAKSLDRNPSRTFFHAQKPISSDDPDISRMFNVLGIKKNPDPDPRAALETVHRERNGQSESALIRATGAYFRAASAQRRRDGLALAHHLIDALPEPHLFIDGLKRACSGRDKLNDLLIGTKAMGEATGTIGAGIAATQLVSDVIISFVQSVGVFRTLGVAPVDAPQTKVALVTSLPTPVWQSQDQQPDNVSADTGLAGSNVSGKISSVSVYETISRELWQDESVSSHAAILYKLGQGLSLGIDTAAFSGTGVANSTTDGGFTGLFLANGVPAVNAGAGNTTVASLQREDFMNALAALNPFAIQNGIAAWCHPAFIPALMTIKGGPSGQFLIKTPLENNSDSWSLCGFELNLTTTAPSAAVPGSQIVAIGHGPGYVVTMRQELEIMSSQIAQWNQNNIIVRAIMRARADMAQPTWFAILKSALN